MTTYGPRSTHNQENPSIQVRRAQERGHADHGWLDTWHTFSFSSYYDPAHMSFRALRVMNEDFVAPSRGFGTHPHNDMEIVTYVLEGELEHRDSMGHREVLRAGEFQRISAGIGITHSEVNASQTERVHLYQIWLLPIQRGLNPSYEQRKFPDSQLSNQLRLVASPDRAEDSLLIQTDARVYLGKLEKEKQVSLTLAPQRSAWLQVLRGSVALNGIPLFTADGAAICRTQQLEINATEEAEVLLFDLA